MKIYTPRQLKSQSGQTMVDLIIALALLALAISSAGALATATTRATNEAGRRSQATALATREIEALKNYRDSKARMDERWVGIPSGSGAGNCASFIMRRGVSAQGQNVGWQIVSSASPTAFSDSDDTGYGKFDYFRRLVTICNGQDYDALARVYKASNDVKTVQVEVFWDEGDSQERKLTFNSILTNWETR